MSNQRPAIRRSIALWSFLLLLSLLFAAVPASLVRSAQFYVSAVDANERDGEAAIVYAIETTEQRTLTRSAARYSGPLLHALHSTGSARATATTERPGGWGLGVGGW